MQKALAIWWLRIILFLALTAAEYFIMKFTFGLPASLLFLVSILLSSMIIESLRAEGRWFSFGFRIDLFALRDIGYGLLISLASLGLIALAYYLAGNRLISVNPGSSKFFIEISLMIFFLSTIEELVFRGIIFQALINKFGENTSIIVLSFIFAFSHLANFGITPVAVLNILIANILLSLMYTKTLSLWLPVTFHFLWNWGEQVLLGSPISGSDMEISMFRFVSGNQPTLIFGGMFGIEGGFITTFVLLLSIYFVIYFVKQSPYMFSRLFKIKLAEEQLLNNK